MMIPHCNIVYRWWKLFCNVACCQNCNEGVTVHWREETWLIVTYEHGSAHDSSVTRWTYMYGASPAVYLLTWKHMSWEYIRHNWCRICGWWATVLCRSHSNDIACSRTRFDCKFNSENKLDWIVIRSDCETGESDRPIQYVSYCLILAIIMIIVHNVWLYDNSGL